MRDKLQIITGITGLITALACPGVSLANDQIEDLVLGFGEVRCGSDIAGSKPRAAKKYSAGLTGPSKYYGIPVIPHDYKKWVGSLKPILRRFDTMQVTFNYYAIDVTYGTKFQFVGYDRFIYLSPESEIESGLEAYQKVEEDLKERLGKPLEPLELMAYDLISKYGRHVTKWWRYEQTKNNGDILLVGLNDGVYKGDRYAVISSICDLEWRSIMSTESLLNLTKQKGNLFK